MRVSHLCLCISMFVFLGCSAIHSPRVDEENTIGNSNGISGQVSEADSVAMFAQTLHPVLSQHCARCHGNNQLPLHSVADTTLAHNNVTQGRLVNFSDVESSRLVAKIRGGHQGFAATVADEILAGIQGWLELLSQASPGDELPVDIPEAIPLTASFKSIHANILQPRCVGCHNPNGEEPEFDYTDYQSTLSRGEVTPGDPQDSAMFTECNDGSMPQGSDPLTAEELAAIEQWILDGAPDN